jgi:long-chain acyl-CoA synthetase
MTEFRRLFDAFRYQQEQYPVEDSLAEKVNGQWIKYSSAEVISQCDAVSRGLYKHGIRPGDKIAIIATNRPTWNFLDVGMMQAGAINVPVYPNISLDDYRFILSDAEVKTVFVGDRSLYNKISPLQKEIHSIEKIYTLSMVEGAPHWSEILEGNEEVDQNIIEAIMEEIEPDDLATIIYTSGTTGTPKGVMLSHNNIISNAKAAAEIIEIRSGHRILSSLPICHIFERMACYLFFYVGARVYYAERVESIADNLKEVKPHFFTTVPRLLEKLYEKIMEKGKALTGAQRKIFDWAMKLAEQYQPYTRQNPIYAMQLALARKLVFSKWQAAVGGEILGIVSGAAALQPRLARIFSAAGIPVIEGYGQTEASPVIAANRFSSDSRLGTVGPALPGVTVKIAIEDGEILVKGPNVMLGYYKRPDLTMQTIDHNGWLHTGDVGKLVEGRYLKITDRKKELFKTSGGKYVAPQVIENVFKESFFIENILVVGENRKTISALIVPSVPVLEKWCEEYGLHFDSKSEMLQSPAIHKKFSEIRDQFNKRFSEVERVKKFALLGDTWSIETGELTPTAKIKRKVVVEKYKNVIENLYRGE